MNVVGAEVEALRLPLRRPLATSQGALAIREGFLLRLRSDTGVTGIGEASPAYWIGEGSPARTADDLRRVVALVGRQPRSDAVRARLLDGAAGASISPAAACAVDGALLDLEARTRGVGLGAVLGAAGAADVPIAALIGGAAPDLVMAEVEAALTAGFQTLKLKVGIAALADEVWQVAAVRARVGAGVRLRLDANRAWAPEDARRALAAFAPFDVEYVEEPLRSAEPEALAALARATPVPLAVDESIVDAADVLRLVAAGARVHVVLKAARVGGPTRLVALARLAHAAGLPVIVTDSIESTIGMSVAVHVAAALPGPRFAVGLGGAQLLMAESGVAPHPLCRPWLAPVGPGWGVAPGGEAGKVARHG
jgi:o-succinylbenzoate synthase